MNCGRTTRSLQLIFGRRVSWCMPLSERAPSPTKSSRHHTSTTSTRASNQYRKEEFALHTEKVINDTYDFDRQRLCKLDNSKKIGFAVNRRHFESGLDHRST